MPSGEDNIYQIKKIWLDEEVDKALLLQERGYSLKQISQVLNRSYEAVRSKLKRVSLERDRGFQYPIPDSRFERYDDPLVMEGDAIVLPDIELPFHNAEFMSRCLELADAWGIRKAIVAGDLLHFESLTTWQANWVSEGGYGLSDKAERKLMEFARSLPEEYQEEMIDTIISLDEKDNSSNTSVSQELRQARKVIKIMTELFDEIDFILGNHDDRFLRALNNPMFPSELLTLVEAGDKWRVKPYYFSILVSNGEKYQIEHPKTWAKSSPYKLAAKFQCHVLQAHSHRWGMEMDISGQFYAIHMGCIVDEFRLPYASQRHNTADTHALGAVIVRDGFPFLLSDKTPWDTFKSRLK